MQNPEWSLLIKALEKSTSVKFTKECLLAVKNPNSVGDLPSNRLLTENLIDIYTVRSELFDPIQDDQEVDQEALQRARKEAWGSAVFNPASVADSNPYSSIASRKHEFKPC